MASKFADRFVPSRLDKVDSAGLSSPSISTLLRTLGLHPRHRHISVATSTSRTSSLVSWLDLRAGTVDDARMTALARVWRGLYGDPAASTVFITRTHRHRSLMRISTLSGRNGSFSQVHSLSALVYNYPDGSSVDEMRQAGFANLAGPCDFRVDVRLLSR